MALQRVFRKGTSSGHLFVTWFREDSETQFSTTGITNQWNTMKTITVTKENLRNIDTEWRSVTVQYNLASDNGTWRNTRVLINGEQIGLTMQKDTTSLVTSFATCEAAGAIKNLAKDLTIEIQYQNPDGGGVIDTRLQNKILTAQTIVFER